MNTSPSPVAGPSPPPRRPGRPAAVEMLDDPALLLSLLTRAAPRASAERLSCELLARFGSLSAVVAADPAELARTPGLSNSAVGDLKLIKSLCERLCRTEASRRPVVSSWCALTNNVRIALAHEPREQFRVLYLDRRNVLMRDEMVAAGTVDHAPVYPREVIRRALELSASAMILVHNHPSGDPTPSRADIEMTRQIVEAARVFNLQVHDHLVIGREGTASFKALGLI